MNQYKYTATLSNQNNEAMLCEVQCQHIQSTMCTQGRHFHTQSGPCPIEPMVPAVKGRVLECNARGIERQKAWF